MASRKVFELRTYVLKPHMVGAYKNLTTENFHLRLNHSTLNGFWFHELGGQLNAATHIWEYNSLDERAQIRKNLEGDADWVSKYVKELVTCLDSQVNKVCVIPDWAEEFSDFSNATAAQSTGGKTYEIISFNKNNSKTELLKSVVKSYQDEVPNTKIIGVLETIIGGNGEYNVLLSHENVNSSVRDSELFCKEQQNCVMLPAPWSPMKWGHLVENYKLP